MRLRLSSRPFPAAGGAALGLPFFEGPAPGPGVEGAEAAFGTRLTSALRSGGFRGRTGDHATVLLPGTVARTVIALGLGPEPPGTQAVRDAAQRLGGLAAGFPRLATTLPLLGADREASTRAVAEGLLLGAHRSHAPGGRPVEDRPPPPPREVTLVVDRVGVGVRQALDRGVVAAGAANWARDLVHAPAATATPAWLCDEIARVAREHGCRVRIWTGRMLERGGFGGVLGVGRGSRNEPRLIEIEHRGGGGRPVALAGKGITFDSGGLNLKRDPQEIAWMRSDMAGGAAVVAAVVAAARLDLPVRAVAAVPLAENMPGGAALRPGDVLRHRGGRTSEVMDTDNEGRLVVADALAYLAERRPVALIDVATLTDAAGLGPALWAAMGTDDALLTELLRAGERAGEPGWRMPLPGYAWLLGSDAADLRNAPSKGPDTSVVAATFLREFVGDVPWAHIDNGSTAWLEFDTPLWPEGATGSPTRALIRFLEDRAAVELRSRPATRRSPRSGAR